MNPKILILIKSHINSDYHDNLFKEINNIWSNYMNSFDGVTSYFIMGNPDLEDEYLLEDNILWCRTIENHWDGLLNKVYMSLKYFENKYDFIFIVNSSSFVNIPNLVNKCKTLPLTNICMGFIRKKICNGIKIRYPSGSGILLTNDIINIIFGEPINKTYPQTDDLYIGYKLNQLNILTHQMDRVDVKHNRFKLANVIYYKIKFADRNRDIFIHRYLLNVIYNKLSLN